MDDNELMSRLALGDLDALTELVRRHRPWAEHLAESLLGDPAAAEDVAQEAFARVYLLRQRYQPTFAFRTWLGVMVRRLCIDQLRRQKRAPLLTDQLPEGLVDSAEEAALAREKRMELWEALYALPDQDRRLLEGYALEGLSYRELAQREHMSLSLVKIRLHRIRKLLQKRTTEKERDRL